MNTNTIKGFLIIFVTGLLFALMIGLTIFNVFYRTRKITKQLITEDIQELQVIFDRINQTCGILSFDFEKNHINFLNVKSFTGSEVGPMNLVDPSKWDGPYLQDNPTIQGKEYEVVRTKNGYFIVPGDGVKLPNGKVIGKDIIFTKNTDIESMIKPGGDLNINDKELAAPIQVQPGFLERIPLVP